MSAVDGLITGMNTTDIIRQLMQLERQPVVRMEAKKAAFDKAITALQALNTKFLALSDLAKGFTVGGWVAGGATSSDPTRLGVSVASGTAATTLNVTVNSLAATHKISSSLYTTVDADRVTDPSSAITIAYLDADGAQQTMTVTNHTGTMQSIADAVNATSTAPVTAQRMTDGTNVWLEFTAKKAGDLSRFDVTIPQRTVNPGSGVPQVTFSVTTAGTDAEVLVGTAPYQTSVKGTTNTLEVAPGIMVNLLQADPATSVTISVTEASKPSGDVEKLVAAANELLKEIKSLTSYDAAAKKSGLLQGNVALRDLQSRLLTAVYQTVDGASAGDIGLELTRDGMLQFDKAKFDTAYAADPTAVSAMFVRDDGIDGIATRFAAIAESATKFQTGSVSQLIDSRRSEIKRIDDSLATWDVRLAAKEARFRRQFAALETMLGAAQQQGNWLAGQLSSLPTWES